MIPSRHFAGRAVVTPPTSDSESESKSGSDVEPIRRAPVPRRRRFVARVVQEPQPDERTRAEVPKPAKGFVPLKDLQQNTAPQVRKPSPQLQAPVQGPLPDRPPPSPSSPSSSSQSSESGSERSGSPPRQQPPPIPSFKPVFIKPKAKEAPDTSRQESRALERKEEAHQLVSAALKEEEAFHRIERHVDLPDDADHERDRQREEALWRVREMRRVLREREAEKAWRNRGKVEKVPGDADGAENNDDKEMRERGREGEVEKAKKEGTRSYTHKVGPFFIERDEDGKLTEKIYNRELQDGRGGLSGLPVGRDGGKAGRTKFAGLAKEDTAAEMAHELKRDRELAAALEAARRR